MTTMFEIVLESSDGRKHNFIESGLDKDDASKQIKLVSANAVAVLLLMLIPFLANAQDCPPATTGKKDVTVSLEAKEAVQGTTPVQEAWYIQIAILTDYPRELFPNTIGIHIPWPTETDPDRKVWVVIYKDFYPTERAARSALAKMKNEYTCIGLVKQTLGVW